jgi:antitoxin (DNA-binding transcriptional repressor) of toxin-antitoxin stability system
MESMTIRELRNTRRLQALLRSGKSIELRCRTQVIARIMPEPKPEEIKKIEWPDFEARRRKIFGNRKLNAVKNFLKDRHRD